MAGSMLCRPLRELLHRSRTAAAAIRWLRRASVLREGRRRLLLRRRSRRGYASPAAATRQRLAAAGRPSCRPSPAIRVSDGPCTDGPNRRQASAAPRRRALVVGSMIRGARWGASGPPRAPCHGEYLDAAWVFLYVAQASATSTAGRASKPARPDAGRTCPRPPGHREASSGHGLRLGIRCRAACGRALFGSGRARRPTAGAGQAGSCLHPASRCPSNAALGLHAFSPASQALPQRSLRRLVRQPVRPALHLEPNTVASRISAHPRPSLEGPVCPWTPRPPRFRGYASPNVIPGSVSPSELRILGITSAARCPPSTPSPGNFKSCGCFVFTAISPWSRLPPSSSPPPAGAPVRPVAPSSIAKATFTALNSLVVVLVVVVPVTSMHSPLQALRCSPRLPTFRSWTSP